MATYLGILLGLASWPGAAAFAAMFLLLTVLVFVMHNANIMRLATGIEAKIGGSGRAS